MKTAAQTSKESLRIIIVEDDASLRDILVSGLSHFGHNVRGVGDSISLDIALAESPPDIVILDLGLPGEDGISIAKRVRRSHNCGIVIVTARGQVDDRVTSFGSGADQYFVKPVNIRELDAALRNLARRISGQHQPVWRFNVQASKLYTPQGVQIHLTALECIFVRKLVETPGENVSRQAIFTALGQPNDHYADKRLEAMISRLRAKVRVADSGSELPVHARHNLGYAFLAEITK